MKSQEQRNIYMAEELAADSVDFDLRTVQY
jgi:hypothetical protein